VAPGVERQRDARAVRKDSARVDEGQIVGRLDAFVANLTGGEGVDRAFVRPLVRAINRQPMDDTEVDRTYVAYVVCDVSAEPRARAILIEGLTAASHIELSELEIANIEDTDRVEMTATITSHKRRELALETVIGRLSKESGVLRAGWREHTQSV
jgi:hypothetical protein